MELLALFVTVLGPILALITLGYAITRPLALEAHTLSRLIYYILIPAFIIEAIGRAEMGLGTALRFVALTLLWQGACALLALLVARLRRAPAPLAGAYVLVAVFGNAGNFALPVITFHLGEGAKSAAALGFLVVNIVGFAVGLAAARAVHGGRGTLLSALRTPALVAVLPALLLRLLGWELPLALGRALALLSEALVPVMLLTLGVQLALAGRIRLTADVALMSALRLVAGPLAALALLLVLPLPPAERGAALIHASTPIAIITSVIALEHELAPELVTAAVLLSTLLSPLTLTVVLALAG